MTDIPLIEGVILFDAKNSNPNGDPDMNNRPRTNPDGYGIATPMCNKRKVRNRIALVAAHEKLDGCNIYVSNDQTLTERKVAILKSIGCDVGSTKEKVKLTPEQSAQAFDLMCDTYWDVRVFGAVLSTNVGIRNATGPVQISMAQSVDPIDVTSHTITRCAKEQMSDKEEENQTMGVMHTVSYGLYRMRLVINPFLAAKTNMKLTDLDLLRRELPMIFVTDVSASRPEMTMRGIYVFQHSSPLGNTNENLSERIKVRRRDPSQPARCFDDYEIDVPMADTLPKGITMDRWA